jgi:hypothetical protein
VSDSEILAASCCVSSVTRGAYDYVRVTRDLGRGLGQGCKDGVRGRCAWPRPRCQPPFRPDPDMARIVDPWACPVSTRYASASRRTTRDRRETGQPARWAYGGPRGRRTMSDEDEDEVVSARRCALATRDSRDTAARHVVC